MEAPSKKSVRAIARSAIRDANGNVVIYQRPNIAILIALAALLLSQLTEGLWHASFLVIAFGAFFTWATMELFHGVNYFRRALGFVVMVVIVISAINFLK